MTSPSFPLHLHSSNDHADGDDLREGERHDTTRDYSLVWTGHSPLGSWGLYSPWARELNDELLPPRDATGFTPRREAEGRKGSVKGREGDN